MYVWWVLKQTHQEIRSAGTIKKFVKTKGRYGEGDFVVQTELLVWAVELLGYLFKIGELFKSGQ